MLTILNVILAFILLFWLGMIAYALILDRSDWREHKKSNASLENR